MKTGDAAGSAPPRSGPRHLLIYSAAIAVLALGAVSLLLWFTSAGIGLTTDSAVYLGTADNLTHGRGVTTPFAGDTTRYSPARQVSFGPRIPVVEYPPVYPLALSIPRAGGLASSGAASAINSLSLAGLVALIGVALWWLLRAPLLVVVVVETLVVCGPTVGTVLGALNPLGLASFALSEALFLPLCLAALLAGARAATTAGRGAVMVAVGLAGLAALTRYVGVSAGVGAAAAVLLTGHGSRRHRTGRAVAMAAGGPVAVVTWNLLSRALWGGGTARTIVWHPSSLRPRVGVAVMGAWFHLPVAWPFGLRTALIVAVVLVPGGLMLVSPIRRWLQIGAAGDLSGAVMIALGTFILAYLLAVALTEALLDAGTQPNQRLLAPVQVASYLLLVSLAVRLFEPRRLGYAVVVIGAVALAFQPLSRLRVGASALQDSATTARHQAATEPLRGLPPDVVVFTDDPGGLWLYAGQGSYRLPTTTIETTGQTDRSYQEEVHQVIDIVEQRGGLIVLPPGGSGQYTAGSLRTVGRCVTGDVVLGVPGTPAALAASARCPLN